MHPLPGRKKLPAACISIALLMGLATESGFAATNASAPKTNAVPSMANTVAGVTNAVTGPRAIPVLTNFPVSVFVDVIGQGRDPFFPGSQRRMKVAAPVATDVKPVNTKLADSLYLEGMITGKNPIVIINDTVIQANKALTQNIKVGGESLMIRFLEFKKRSVIIEVGSNGEKKEVRFRDGL